MLTFTPSEISLADAVAVLQLINGVRQLFAMVRSHGAALPADAIPAATFQVGPAALDAA